MGIHSITEARAIGWDPETTIQRSDANIRNYGSCDMQRHGML